MQPTIRPERPGEEQSIGRIIEAAFAVAEHSDGTEQFIVSALRKRGELTVSLVAEHDGVLIGHAAASPVLIPGATGWFGLAPVSVVPEFQGRGVGKQLVRAVMRALNDAAGCVVLGDPAYYGQFGFEADGELTLASVPAEYFQSRIIKGPAARGEVQYSEAFNATS